MFSSKTRENTLCEFSLVIATVAKVSRKRGLWLVVRVIYCFTEVDCWDIFFSTKKSTSQINSKKCSCCHAYQSLIQWINFDFILKPVPFHLKFVILHNDSSFSQILLSNAVWHHGFRHFIFNFSTALHQPEYGYQPSEDEAFLRLLPRG